MQYLRILHKILRLSFPAQDLEFQQMNNNNNNNNDNDRYDDYVC